MIIGALDVSIMIPDSHSLKEKRRVIRSLKDRIKKRFNVSLAETEGQNTWQRCELTVVMVACQKTAIERELNRIVDLIGATPEAALTEHWIEYY